jgi:hypothetical protein
MTVIEDAQQLVEEAQRSARERLEERKRELDALIAPLDAERRAVEHAIQGLTTKKVSTLARRHTTLPRATRKERHDQVLQLVRSEPGLTTADLGRRLELSSNRATALVKELREANMLRDGQPLRVVEDEATAEPPADAMAQNA